MRWLTDDIATAAFSDVSKESLEKDIVVVDVRDLVDKIGNDPVHINARIDEALALLKDNKKIIICCDYGMSRSNSVAIGVITRWRNISFSDAVSLVTKRIDGSGVKIEMLNTVYDALYGHEEKQTKDSNILVTGGSGFVGRKLTASLDKSAKVHTPTSADIDLINDILKLDLFVKEKEIDTIVHLANPRIFTTNKSVGDSLVMLKNVLDVCRTNNVRLVYLSGWEIYSGYKSSGLLADEKLQAFPKGTYGETKWFCELLIKQYAQVYGIQYQIIRSGPVYGPGGEKPKFLYNFIEKARAGNDIFTHRYANGSPILDLLFVDDLVTIVGKITQSEFTGDINIGSSIGTSTFQIATVVCELTSSHSKIKEVDVLDHSSNIIMNNAMARSMFNWSPVVDIKSGIQQILTAQ